jgi:hypothetical protein
LLSASTGITIAVDESASAAPDDYGGDRWLAERESRDAYQSGTSDNLQRSKSEHQMAHSQQSLEWQFEPNHEQQKYDSELG